MTNLMNDAQINDQYTIAQLVELIKAKGDIISPLYNQSLPKGWDKMKKVKLIEVIRALDAVLYGGGKEVRKRTVKVSRYTVERAKLWSELQGYLQGADCNGEWMNISPTLDNVVLVSNTINKWLDGAICDAKDIEASGYIYNLVVANNSRIQTCDTCDNRMIEGYIFESDDLYYCSDVCMCADGYTMEEFNEFHAEGNGDVYWTDWRDA